MKKKKKVNFKIVPGEERVIISLIKASREISPILMPGQLKAGEALYCGEIIHPGSTSFKKGQVVYYSEYSAAKLINMGSVLRKEQSLGDALRDECFVVAADDVMAYEEELFEFAREGTEKEIEKLRKKMPTPGVKMMPEEGPTIITETAKGKKRTL